jgi:LETM1 and EF-hand domain-containing protein 1
MIKKIDGQLEKYDEKVGSSLNIIHTNAKGQISLKDLETAFRAIKHAPAEEMVEKLGEKLDVDKDGFVVSFHPQFVGVAADVQELDHVVDLAQERDFGIGLEEEAKDILGQGKDIRTSKELKELR